MAQNVAADRQLLLCQVLPGDKQRPLESWLDAQTKQIYGKAMAKSDQRMRGEQPASASANRTLEKPGSTLGKTQYLMAGVTVLTNVFSFLSGL